MNIQPPVAMKFETITPAQVASALAGVCPHRCAVLDGRAFITLETKHTCESIQFKQCSRCKVVVALERS